MKKKKWLYYIDVFKWIQRKDNSGLDKCYTEGISAKTVFGLCFHIIKVLRENDGVTVTKTEWR